MKSEHKYSEVAAEAYQVIGALADALGYFSDDVDDKMCEEITRALDYFAALMCEEKKPFEILPFGDFDPECQKKRWQKQLQDAPK